MTYNPDVHHRHSIRLRDFDYASTGAYYVTICTQGRICLFGDVVDGMMVENDAGRAVGKWWHELTKKFPFVEPDCFVAMPNHCHGIIYLVGADLRVRPDAGVGTAGHTHRYATTIGNRQIHAPTKGNQAITQAGAPLPDMPTTGGHTGPPLPTIMQWFKTMTTNEYMKTLCNPVGRHFLADSGNVTTTNGSFAMTRNWTSLGHIFCKIRHAGVMMKKILR